MANRYMVVYKSGRKFMVEEWGTSHTDWGNINPATKKLEKVTSKNQEVIDESNTMITKDKYKNIAFLSPGTSPLGVLDAIDQSGVERIICNSVSYID